MADADSKHPTVERLLAALQRSGEFPAMAHTVSLIGSLTSSAATSSGELADTILQDYGLTQKVLRLVNTAAFAQYDQVTTITRAVVLMGFERIRGIATGLILFEHLQKQVRTGPLVDTLNMSFYSAILGQTLSEHSGCGDEEEAFICGLFHRIGRLLVAFYLPEDWRAIQALESGSLETRAREVLGLTFQQVGLAAAHELKLPEMLVQSMTPVPSPDARTTLTEGEKLSCVASLANDITDVLSVPGDARRKRAAIERLLSTYGPHIKVSDQIEQIIASSVKRLRESSTPFKLNLSGSRFLAGISEWRVASLVASGEDAGGVTGASSAGALISDAMESDGSTPAEELPETILTKGLHELTALLVGDFKLDDVLRVALETMYRALGVGRTRVFFLLRDPASGVARFRFGFGQTVPDMKFWLEVPIRGSEDLISLSLTEQKDIVVKDTRAPEVAHALPGWYTARGVVDRYIVLLPLVIEQKAVGLFYIDGERSRIAVLTPAVQNFLKILRSQAALAIRQKSSRSGPRR